MREFQQINWRKMPPKGKTLLDKQQMKKITEKARFDFLGSQDQDVKNLRQQLNEFIEERQGWLQEIDRRQAELVAAQIAIEKHHQQEQLLGTENEALKEENNVLKIQNEDLASRLRRAESYLSRIREELAHYCACNGRSPHINFDEEQRLNDKLQETEKEKLYLAQTVLALCTSILKAAGVTKPTLEIDLSIAEEALKLIEARTMSLEREVEDLKLNVLNRPFLFYRYTQASLQVLPYVLTE